MRLHLASLPLLLLVGCVAPPQVRAPAMPTVGGVPAGPTPAERELRAVRGAVDAARSGRMSEAVGALAVLADPAARMRATEQAIRELAATEPAVAGALAVALEAGPAQASGIGHAARAWAARDANTALAWAAGLAGPAAGVALREVAAAGVLRSPRVLLQGVEAWPDTPARAEARLALAAAWAGVDPDAALDWLGGQREDPRLRAAMIFAVGQRHPRRASGLLGELPASRERLVLAAAIAQTWVAQDRAAALAWANELALGAERDAALAGIETGLGVPVARRRGNAPGQRGIRSRGLGGGDLMLRTDAPEFAAWLATQPPGRDLEAALLDFVRERGPADTGAIGRWLAGLPGSAAREQALQIYLEGRLAASAADAAAFLRELPRSDVSDAMVEQIARRWLITNPDAAVPWLRAAPLPEFQKDRLLREAGR
ncbi:MAG: hypothetical protein JNL39_03935 [Opitutaceae bacterium]|nr:hypothetical protein [Opitutaceae bacterium]